MPAELTLGAATYRIGDKVIQTRNNYDKNIFNGDTGILLSIAPDASFVTIEFDGQNVEYTKSELSEVQHAYAISIHKSQGSEYPVVLIPLLKQHFMMLQRNLVYTGITALAKKSFLLALRKPMQWPCETIKLKSGAPTPGTSVPIRKNFGNSPQGNQILKFIIFRVSAHSLERSVLKQIC